MTTITKEMVQERLELYQKEFQQLLNMQKIYEGAIQDCTFWKEQLEKEEEVKDGSA